MSPAANSDHFSSYSRLSDRVMPRTQREAGIEWHGWEGRIKPRLPWTSIIAITAGLLAIGIALALAAQFYTQTGAGP